MDVGGYIPCCVYFQTLIHPMQRSGNRNSVCWCDTSIQLQTEGVSWMNLPFNLKSLDKMDWIFWLIWKVPVDFIQQGVNTQMWVSFQKQYLNVQKKSKWNVSDFEVKFNTTCSTKELMYICTVYMYDEVQYCSSACQLVTPNLFI